MESGNFAFTTAETGDYTTCFWAPENKPPTTVTVEFEWRTGVAATDWSNVAKKGQIEVSNCYDTKLSLKGYCYKNLLSSGFDLCTFSII